MTPGNDTRFLMNQRAKKAGFPRLFSLPKDPPGDPAAPTTKPVPSYGKKVGPFPLTAMTSNRVSYVESVLCEAVVDAMCESHATGVARRQMEDAEHQCDADVWNPDWFAEPAEKRPPGNERCFESGNVRK